VPLFTYAALCNNIFPWCSEAVQYCRCTCPTSVNRRANPGISSSEGEERCPRLLEDDRDHSAFVPDSDGPTWACSLGK
jgi:hypothetical protein